MFYSATIPLNLLEEGIFSMEKAEKKVKIHLSKLLGERKLNQADFARKSDIRPNTVSELYHEFAKSVKLEHLVKICDALGCSLSELMEYTPEQKGNRKVH